LVNLKTLIAVARKKRWRPLMLSIIATVALVLAVIIAGVLAYASTRPGNFRVGRSASIKAPDRLFPLINNLQALNTWNLTLVRTHAANGLALAIVARSVSGFYGVMVLDARLRPSSRVTSQGNLSHFGA
jgi:hypothetical protein